MADTQEIEDTVEDKAAAIGKELGVEDNKPSDIPDYDIEEVPDEKIGKEREPVAKTVKPEHKQLTNKEKRDLRKKRVAEKFNEKDSIILAQQAELEHLKRWKSGVDNQLSNISKAEIDAAINKNVADYNFAKQMNVDAFKEGDGDKSNIAVQGMYTATRNIEQLRLMKQQSDSRPQQEQVQQNGGADPVIANRAKAWAERNTWYKTTGTDTDSEIAKALSQVLANEGYDPKSDDFWDELDERLEEKNIGQREDADDDEENVPVISKPKKRSSPPVASGANRGDLKGKTTVSLPTAFINTLKENGYWEDKPKRDRMIKGYLEGVKNRADSN